VKAGALGEDGTCVNGVKSIIDQDFCFSHGSLLLRKGAFFSDADGIVILPRVIRFAGLL
jgi:hypothetical protein